MADTLWNDWTPAPAAPAAPADLSGDWGDGRTSRFPVEHAAPADLAGDWGKPPADEHVVGHLFERRALATAKATQPSPPAVADQADKALTDAPETPTGDDQVQADANAQTEDTASEGEYDDAAFACFNALRESWGADFEANLAVARQVRDDAPAPIAQFFREFKFEDGTAIANVPDVVQWLHSLAPGSSNAPLPTAPVEKTLPQTATQAAQIRATSAQLQAMWGRDWRTTLQGVKNLVYAAPPFVREFILSAQYVDGYAVANDPLVLNWLAQYVPSGQSIDAEIAQIEAKIGTKEYIRSEAMQARLRSLYAARGH